MVDKVLCFKLNGFSLGVESDQIERILVNKRPGIRSFTLETGVEVKSLLEYIPLPGETEPRAANIIFIDGQKECYGFSVDSVQGYLRIRGVAKPPEEGQRAPIKYFIKSGESTIPVLDLRYITNELGVVNRETIDSIVDSAKVKIEAQRPERRESGFQGISEQEIYRSIEEEIKRQKNVTYAEDVIISEKRGMLFPLIVNIVIIAVFAAGTFAYLTFSKEKTREQALAGSISGVEEEVIREVRRRSEEEVKEQQKRLEDAKSRLAEIQKERDFFLQNQDRILAEKEKKLNEEFSRKLEEARQRIMASGVENAEAEYEKEKKRLIEEFQRSKNEARVEIDRMKREYEEALAKKESEINREVNLYTKQLKDIEQQLLEERVRLRETEEKFQRTVSSQQQYLAFRQELSTLYNRALMQIARKDYQKGIEELNSMLPVIEKARQSGAIGQGELNVEERLVRSMVSLVESEKNRIDLNRVASSALESAQEMERIGNLQEALSGYFTAYSLAADRNFKAKASSRAYALMEKIYRNRMEEQKLSMNAEADSLFSMAMGYKEKGEYDNALNALRKIVTDYQGAARVKESLSEIQIINNLKALKTEKERAAMLDEKAMELMESAKKSYASGYILEALNKYEEVVRRFQGSSYVEKALSEIVRINESIREQGTGSSIFMVGGEATSGVIVQMTSENTFIFNLGIQDGLKEGDTVKIYRREGDNLRFIGSMQVFEVYPTVSKGRLLYYEKKFKVGDIVARS
jgi:hypothetical protein